MQWNEIDKTISKTFEFNSYLDGIDFVNEIANLAEQENHHPDIIIGYCKVTVSLTTHDAGEIKLTLWADDIDKVKDGDKVKITNGYTNEFKGEVSIGKGKFGQMEVVS